MGQLEDILKHQNMVRNNIMKSFEAETSEDSLEKSFEDEVNPFEMEAYKSELTKAELDEFEKAKHQDGDMHPNGKWVWRQSANGGKGDWRVAKTGGSKATNAGAAATKTTSGDSKVAKFMDALKTVNNKYTDESKVSVMKTPKGNWEVSYDGHVVGTVTSGILSEKVAKDKGWLKDDDTKKAPKKTVGDKKLLSQNDKTSIRNVVKKMFGNNLTSLSFTAKDELIVKVEGKAYGDGYGVWQEWKLKNGKPTEGGYSGDTNKSRIDELMRKLGEENLKKLTRISLEEDYD